MSSAKAKAALRRRAAAQANSLRPATDQVGAESKNDFYRKRGKEEDSIQWNVAGKHGGSTYRELVFSFLLETWGAWLIATVVPLCTWFASSEMSLVSAMFVATAGAGSWFVATRSGMYVYKLRRHCNAAITIFYWFVGEIGLPGVAYYLAAQTLGSIFGGITTGLLLRGLTGSAVSPVRLPVPFPTETITRFTTVWALELIGCALLSFFLGLNEFINTKGVSETNSVITIENEDAGSENERKLRANYENSTLWVAGLLFLFILIGYQFQVITFSNVSYSGGLFSGWLATSGDVRDFHNMQHMQSATYPGSVWGTRHGAAAFYNLMPWAGGALGAIFFWVVFYVAIKMWPATKEEGAMVTRTPRYNEMYARTGSEAKEPLLAGGPTPLKRSE